MWECFTPRPRDPRVPTTQETRGFTQPVWVFSRRKNSLARATNRTIRQWSNAQPSRYSGYTNPAPFTTKTLPALSDKNKMPNRKLFASQEAKTSYEMVTQRLLTIITFRWWLRTYGKVHWVNTQSLLHDIMHTETRTQGSRHLLVVSGEKPPRNKRVPKVYDLDTLPRSMFFENTWSRPDKVTGIWFCFRLTDGRRKKLPYSCCLR